MIQERLEAVITNISRYIALISLAGLIILTFATVLDVLLRWIFSSPIAGVRDTYSLFLTIIITACFPLCIAERSNITIRFLGKILGPTFNKIFDLFGCLVTILFFGVAAWKTWVYANELQVNNENTWILGWPVAPWWRGVTGLICFTIVVLLIVFFKDLTTIAYKKETNRN